MLVDIDKVQKIILSDVEASDFHEGRLENRAIEVFTTDGRKVTVTLTGQDLRIFGEGEREYKKEGL